MTNLKNNSFYFGIAIICIIAIIKLIPSQKDDTLVVLSCNGQQVLELFKSNEKLQSFSDYILKITKRNGKPDLIFIPIAGMVDKKSLSLKPYWKFYSESDYPPTYKFTLFGGSEPIYLDIDRESLMAHEYAFYERDKQIYLKYECEKVGKKEFNKALNAAIKELKKERDKLQF